MIELGNTDSVRNHVIQFLSQDWPLNVRRLHTKVEQQRPGVSYHAVHKAVQQLLQQGILKREKAGYLLSTEWIEQVHALVHEVKSRQQPGGLGPLPGLNGFKEGESRTFTFGNLVEADAYRKKLHNDYVAAKDIDKPFVGMAQHMKSPLIRAEKSFAEASLAKKTQTYFIVRGKTSLDEWCADFYRSESQRVKTGIEYSQNCDTTVLGDVIVQIYTPSNVREQIDGIYERVRDISELNVSEFYNSVYLMKAAVRLVVTRNAEMAEQLRNKIISYFRHESIAVVDIGGGFINPDYPLEAARWLFGKGVLETDAGKELVELCDRHATGKIERDAFIKSFIKLYASAVKGRKVGEVENALHEFITQSQFGILSKFSKRMFGLLRSYRNVVAVARIPAEFIRAVGGILEFDGIIATTLEVADGRYTGRILQNMCSGGTKARAFEKWLASVSSFKGSIGFGDRVHDAEFLERVEFPIVVNPDAKLAAIAKKRGWFTSKSDSEALLGKLRKILRGDIDG